MSLREAPATVREWGKDFGIEFQNSDQLRVEHTRSFEYLADPFEIATDVFLPIDSYGFQQTRATYSMGPQRRVQGTMTAGRGTFYDGTRTELGYSGRVEVTHRFPIEPRVSLNFVDLVEGRFTATVLSTRATFGFSPRTFLSGLLQYNSSTNTLSTNIRFRWEYQPGSDFYVVYNDGRDTLTPGVPTVQTRAFMVKLTRLFRF